jgi:hypothetical protein
MNVQNSYSYYDYNIDNYFLCLYMIQGVVLWQLVLLVEETGVPRENHRPATSH